MTLDPEILDDEYLGEIAPRSRAVAAVLTTLHPALGYLYVGRPGAAAAAGVLYLVYIGAFLGAWAALGFFPVLPLAVFTLGWFVLAMTSLSGIVRSVDAQPTYILRGYNHPAIYALLFVFAALVPLHAGYYLSTEVLFGIVQVNNSDMFPSVLAGDVVMIDRMAYRAGPGPGDPVVVTDVDGEGGQHRVRLGRVVAVAGDQVRLDGRAILVNDKPLERFVYGDSELPDALAGESATPASRALIEINGTRRYVIADGGAPPQASEETVAVGDGEVLVLGDNRTATGDPLAISSRNVLGRPVFILYSRTPATQGSATPARWQRVGLRLD